MCNLKMSYETQRDMKSNIYKTSTSPAAYICMRMYVNIWNTSCHMSDKLAKFAATNMGKVLRHLHNI